MPQRAPTRDTDTPLYSVEERRRRDASPWTLVQGVLAPIQFAVFLVSTALVWRYLATGAGADVATASVVVKTIVLYTIMITGSIWEPSAHFCTRSGNGRRSWICLNRYAALA